MKKLFLIVMVGILCVSCGEDDEIASKLEVTAFASKVIDAGEEGREVQDPAVPVNDTDRITLLNGYFEFWFDFVNTNDISIVLTEITVDVMRNNLPVSQFIFIPQAHVPVEVFGSVERRFFVHLDPSPDIKQLGGFINGKFYVDDLTRDPNNFTFTHNLRITLKGFKTNTTVAAPGEDPSDPFLDEQGFFERIVVLDVQ